MNRFVFGIALLLASACTTPVTSDKHYPTGWPVIEDAGAECQGFVGTYENKGVAVNERGRPIEVWLSDWIGPPDPMSAGSEMIRQAFLRLSRVELALEPSLLLSSGERYRILSLRPDRPDAGEDLASGARLELVRRMDGHMVGSRSQGTGFPCRHGNLHWLQCPRKANTRSLSACSCTLALGSDGSLIGKCNAADGGILIVVPVYFSDHFWVRFKRAH
jgi:hypothetical protein